MLALETPINVGAASPSTVGQRRYPGTRWPSDGWNSTHLVAPVSRMKVSGAPARAADGRNPNPFYRVHDPGLPLVAPGAPVPSEARHGGVLIDIVMERNGQATLTA